MSQRGKRELSVCNILVFLFIASISTLSCNKDNKADNGPDSGGVDAGTDGDADSDIDSDSDMDGDADGDGPLLSADLSVLMLDPSGGYQWHTFLGSINFGAITGTPSNNSDVTVDSSGNIYIAGISMNPWNGPGGEAPLHAYGPSGEPDVLQSLFVMKLNAAGEYQWHTFVGSDATDMVSDNQRRNIAVDSTGAVYIAGTSSKTWDGFQGEAPLNAHSSDGTDIFVLKLSPAGVYQWHTFYGSASHYRWNVGWDIVSDSNDNVYITGTSDGSWSGPKGEAPLHAYSGDVSDIFVLKLSPSGAYQWHTFYGGAQDSDNSHIGHDIVLDLNDNVYITGASAGIWSGPEGEAPLHAYSSNPDRNSDDIFVLKLSPSGAYQWHTFFGSSNDDSGTDIAVDSAGNVYVTGTSRETWNGPGDRAPLHAHSDLVDFEGELFVLKLDPSGAYQWHTFFDAQDGYAITVNSTLNALYVTGTSYETWNGPAGEAPLHAYSSGNDLLVLELNKSGEYQWHTFFGSSAKDTGSGIALNATGEVIVTGGSAATWNGPEGEAPLHAHSGGGG